MKTRILAAAVLVPILFLLVLVAPTIVASIVFGILLAIGSYELLYRTRLVRHPRLVIYSSLMAFAVVMWSYADAIHAYMVLGVLVSLSISSYFPQASLNLPAMVIGVTDLVLLMKYKVGIPKIILFSAGMGIVLFGVLGLGGIHFG